MIGNVTLAFPTAPPGQDIAATVPRNPVYRLDATTQRMARSSSMQASPSLQQLSRAFNWWGGDGVIYYTLLVLAAGRVLKRRGMAELGVRGAAYRVGSSAAATRAPEPGREGDGA